MTRIQRKLTGLAHPVSIRAGTNDERCLHEVCIHGEYECSFRNDVEFILDAGANIGIASIYFANRYPEAKILSIEPEGENFELLKENCVPYPNIVPVHAAIWHCRGQVPVTDPQKGAWGFRTIDSGTGAANELVEYAQGITIDQLMNQYDFPRIDLLKVDIEGAEKSVFETSAAWLERVQMIMIELHDRFAPGCRAALEAALTQDGRFVDRWQQGENLCVARAGVREPPSISGSREPGTMGQVMPVPLSRHVPQPRIAATILCGNNESLIAEGISSVIDWVDMLVLIDTGITDNSLLIAKSIAGEKLVIRPFAWCNDFSMARNFAITAAFEAGATWALTLDTDERVRVDGDRDIESLRIALSSDADVHAWLVPSQDGAYDKERFVRTDTHLAWSGRTHESLVGAKADERRVLPGWKFTEKRKTNEQFQYKLQRDLTILKEETLDEPGNARWWYYLGQTLEELKQFDEAIDAYQRCFDIRDGWPEQAAWACFQIAKCHSAQHRYGLAVEACSAGLARQPASPELAWQAAYCCYQGGRDADAILWAEIAIRLGHAEGLAAGKNRISFRNLTGWFEGPFDVLRFAYRRTGLAAQADAAERRYHQAKQQRENAASGHACIAATTRIAVLGTYSSGSSAVAGLLHHLGVTMGRYFYGDHYEASWMSEQLRQWWSEPNLIETVAAEQRIRVLKKWIVEMEADTRFQAVRLKHPLLVLSAEDIHAGWGSDVRYLWCHRSLPEATTSLQRRAWWPGREQELQSQLYQKATEWFAHQSHLKIEYADVLTKPELVVNQIVDFLDLKPTEIQLSSAIGSIRCQSN